MSVFNDDVLLIHIPKCAGTSCRDYMNAHLPNAVDSLAEPRGQPLPIDSTPLRHIEEYTGRPLSSWKLIVIPVRDPYKQVVSHWSYHWNRFAIGGRHIHDRTAALHPTVTGWLEEPYSDFRLWYEMAVRGESVRSALEIVDSTGFYEYHATTYDGTVPDNVQFIHVCDLNYEFPRALERYVGGRYPMPRKRSSPHKKDPHAYLSPRGRELVHRRFRWALEHLYETGSDQ